MVGFRLSNRTSNFVSPAQSELETPALHPSTFGDQLPLLTLFARGVWHSA